MRPVLIWKEQPGEFRPLSTPRLRNRLAQASAIPVPESIFETDLLHDRLAGWLDQSGAVR